VRGKLLSLTLLAVLATVLLAAYVYDHSRADVIAHGVKVGGIDVGGLRASAARHRLQSDLADVRSRVVTVQYGGQRFELTGKQARLHDNVEAAVARALSASRRGWFLGRTLTSLFGGRVNADVPLSASYSRATVSAFLERVRRGIDRPPRNATVSVTSSGQLATVPAQAGRTVEVAPLRAQVQRALVNPSQRRVIEAPVRTVTPTVTTSALAAKYPAYIVVDRPAFKLYLYQHLRLTHTYRIAVGMAGLQTPPGLHHILDKQVNPSWHVPNSAWAGALAGKVIPPGPQDPIVARWMAIDTLGDGIHGTDEPWSIGSAASHGCIRMLVPDVIQLYGMTPLGTPVWVV
jgi:lipoprotein-anchoring transpeptidase ErfK/SrfK